jgi:hypothetical protein
VPDSGIRLTGETQRGGRTKVGRHCRNGKREGRASRRRAGGGYAAPPTLWKTVLPCLAETSRHEEAVILICFPTLVRPMRRAVAADPTGQTRLGPSAAAQRQTTVVATAETSFPASTRAPSGHRSSPGRPHMIAKLVAHAPGDRKSILPRRQCHLLLRSW